MLRDRDSRIVAILWLLLLVQGVAFALLQPVWSRVDEAQHFHFVQYLYDQKRLPVEGETFVSPEVVAVSLEAGQWGWHPAGSISNPTRLEPSQWSTVPEELEREDREEWVRRNLWYFNYEAMQPPLYYMVNLPVFAALSGDSLVQLYGMRLLAVLLASAMVPISFLTAREAYPDSRLVTLGTPVIILLTQGYALNMAQVTNDALATPLAASVVLLLLMTTRRGFSWKRSLAIGVLVGAAMLAKMTSIFLLPLVLLAVALPAAFRNQKFRDAAAHAGLMFAPAALLLLPWVLRNLVVYGDATGAAAAAPLMSSFFMSPMIDPNTLRMGELLPTFWFGEPVYPFPFWRMAWLPLVLGMMAALAGIAYFFMYRFREIDGRSRAGVTFLSITLVWGIGISLALPFMSGIGGVPGRYLYPLLPTVAFLLLFGIERLLGRDRARFLAEASLVWLIVWWCVDFLAYVHVR